MLFLSFLLLMLLLLMLLLRWACDLFGDVIKLASLLILLVGRSRFFFLLTEIISYNFIFLHLCIVVARMPFDIEFE